MPTGIQGTKEKKELQGKPAQEALQVQSGLQARVAKEDPRDLREKKATRATKGPLERAGSEERLEQRVVKDNKDLLAQKEAKAAEDWVVFKDQRENVLFH